MDIRYNLKQMNAALKELPAPLLESTEPDSAQRKKTLRMVSRAQAVIDMCAENPETVGVWPLPIKRALDVLTFKQRHFAINIASGLPQLDAYKSAYDVRKDRKDTTLHADVYNIMKSPLIMKAVSLMKEWLDSRWLLENGEGIDYGLSVAFEISSTSTDDRLRLRAAETILRVNGAFVSRSEVKHIHVGESSASDQLIDAIGAMLGLAAAKASSREFITPTELPALDVASERVIDQE